MRKLTIVSIFIAPLVLMAESIQFADSIPVVKSEPVYKVVTKRTPYQECWDEQVPVSSANNNDGTLGALIGGVAGGILGHQVGGGHGKDVATVGGAIIGTLVGKNLADKNNPNSTVTYTTQRKCVTKYNETEEEKFIGYKNVGNYKGKTIIKYSDKPLKNIRLFVTINY
ncbi:MAG: glycine zipper 2TM domain-containing protein [Epsilonproteobacteria bacterium]|nr:glycine zipper 2TM domain-containing protein [Campylobacterota bacterium]